MKEKSEELAGFVIEYAKRIQSIPSLTFHEKTRAAFILDAFTKARLMNVEKDDTGNVYGKIPGGRGLPLVIVAHLDSVLVPDLSHPLTEKETELIGAGIGDNALGVAGLLGLAHSLTSRKKPLPADIWLVATVGEEGLGNLAGMHQVVNRFNQQVIAYLSLEGIGLGMIQTAALGNHRYKIEILAKGGHSWSNYGNPSAIHALIKIGSRLLRMKIPESPRCSINIGTIQGGDVINNIARTAEMHLEVRSEDDVTLAQLDKKIRRIARKRRRDNVQITLTNTGSRPSGRISDSHPLIVACRQALLSLAITPTLAMSSSDASLPISMGYPATCLGITTGRHVHTSEETISKAEIALGMAQILHLIDHLWS